MHVAGESTNLLEEMAPGVLAENSSNHYDFTSWVAHALNRLTNPVFDGEKHLAFLFLWLINEISPSQENQDAPSYSQTLPGSPTQDMEVSRSSRLHMIFTNTNLIYFTCMSCGNHLSDLSFNNMSFPWQQEKRSEQ